MIGLVPLKAVMAGRSKKEDKAVVMSSGDGKSKDKDKQDLMKQKKKKKRKPKKERNTKN